ncbi:MAG: GGDEF domain-containing protein [Eubacterium sp.]|nr:GGDEF domain-containing protein [Eubacterium sp.]
MNEPRKKTIRGIKIRNLNLVMLSVSCILYILLIYSTIQSMHKYNSMVNTTDRHIACEEISTLVADGSNYLTEQVRLYTVTMDTTHLDNYFTEANTTRRRDTALEKLRNYHTDGEAYSYLTSALENSNNLMMQEIYAMKLISTAQGYDMAALQEDIQNTFLTEADQALSPEEMIEKARDIVFGTDYQESKAKIMKDISYFVDNVVEYTQLVQKESSAVLKRSLVRQQILISILFIENLIVFFLIVRLIINPLQIYVKNIKEDKRLEFVGSYEFKYLALTYNNIFELNAANELSLRHQAEHDPLTGLINRGAFDQLKDHFGAIQSPLALLIIDVDKFKLINDGYGHEAGDHVLKKVAALLADSFRSTDYPARIGGDEFAVILTDLSANPKELVQTKIRNMNELLKNPNDDLPPVSLSVGGAYSEIGFTDDLYKKADAALYQVKEHGRCGCRFFDEGTDHI